MDKLQITQGSKLGVHAMKNSVELFDHVRQAAAQGTPFPVVKAVGGPTWLEAIKRDSPQTITVARIPHWTDGLQGIPLERKATAGEVAQWRDAIMDPVLAWFAANPGAVDYVDVFELINEPDPPTVWGWHNVGLVMRACVELGRLRLPGMRWGIVSANYGGPEYNEMVAVLGAGAFDDGAPDIILCLHEGVVADEPINKWFGHSIPGAPFVPHLGGSLNGRGAYWQLAAGAHMVQVLISEFYAGGGYSDYPEIRRRMAWIDWIYRRQPYVVGFTPFSHSPFGWQWQDYTPAYPELLQHMLTVKDEPCALEMPRQVQGISTSHWQGDVAAAHAKAAGADFAVVKLSEALTEDPKGQVNLQRFRDGGLFVGGYHYYRDWADPARQAAFFASLYPAEPALPPVADLEDPDAGPDVAARARAFLQELAALTGARPIIYTARWWWDQHIGEVDWAADYDLYVADYTEPVDLPAGWTRWRLWQYSETGPGATYGVQSQHVTLELFDGDLPTLAAYVADEAPPPPPPPDPGECRGRPREPYARTFALLHPSWQQTEQARVTFHARSAQGNTVGFSADDAGIGDLDVKRVVGYGPWDATVMRAWFAEHYPGAAYQVGEDLFEFDVWPVAGRAPYITQDFGVNPANYPPPLHGHDGLDMRAYLGDEIVAMAPGLVKTVELNHAWLGQYVVVHHVGGWLTYSCHLSRVDVQAGQWVAAGARLGLAGETGNAEGAHLHLRLAHIERVFVDSQGRSWPYGIHDPTPRVQKFLPAPPPPPPPPAGNVLLGLHASADPRLALGELPAFRTARIELVKALSNLDPGDAATLAAALPAAKWIVRAFLHFGGRNVSPAEFVEWTRPDVERTLAAIGRPALVELHNEPNLTAEGLGGSWGDGAGFATWFLDVLARYRAALPGVQFLYPGLSPGGSVAGIRRDHIQFWQESTAAVAAADAMGVHAYWSDVFPMTAAVGQVVGAYALFPGKDLWVTEASHNKAGPTGAEKGAQYVEFAGRLGTVPTVRGVTYFVASASHPDFQNEVWVRDGQSVGIAEVVGGR